MPEPWFHARLVTKTKNGSFGPGITTGSMGCGGATVLLLVVKVPGPVTGTSVSGGGAAGGAAVVSLMMCVLVWVVWVVMM